MSKRYGSKGPFRNKDQKKFKKDRLQSKPQARKKGYKDEYCQKIIQHGSVGGTFSEFAAEIQVNRSTLYEWAQKYPEFREAMEIAKLKNEHYWWELARNHMGKKFNFGVWKFVMVNIHGYKDISKLEEIDDNDDQHVIILPELKMLKEKKSEEVKPEDNLDAAGYTDEGSCI